MQSFKFVPLVNSYLCGMLQCVIQPQYSLYSCIRDGNWSKFKSL